MIPGKNSGECRPIVLVIGQNKPRTARLESVLKQLRDHLIRCDKTKLAVIVTDHIDSEWLEKKYLSMILEFERKGRRFVLLLRGPGRSGLNPILLQE